MKGRNAKETVASNQNLTDGADALGRLRPLHRPLEGPASRQFDERPPKTGMKISNICPASQVRSCFLGTLWGRSRFG